MKIVIELDLNDRLIESGEDAFSIMHVLYPQLWAMHVPKNGRHSPVERIEMHEKRTELSQINRSR